MEKSLKRLLSVFVIFIQVYAMLGKGEGNAEQTSDVREIFVLYADALQCAGEVAIDDVLFVGDQEVYKVRHVLLNMTFLLH